MCGDLDEQTPSVTPSRLQAHSKHTPRLTMASALPTRTFTYYPIWRPSTIDDFTVGPRRNRMERATPSRRATSITHHSKPVPKPISRQIRECWWDGGVDDLINNPHKNKITVFSDYRGNKNVVERTKNNKVFARISYYHDSVVDLSFVTVLPAQVYLHTDQHGTIAYSTGPIISSLPVTTF